LFLRLVYYIICEQLGLDHLTWPEASHKTWNWKELNKPMMKRIYLSSHLRFCIQSQATETDSTSQSLKAFMVLAAVIR
jgi:hypothetical protein